MIYEAMISLTLLLLCCFSLVGAARSMHVGAIIDTDTHEGREQKIAIDIATDRLQSTPFFLGVSKFKSSNILQLASNGKDNTDVLLVHESYVPNEICVKLQLKI